MGLIFLYTFGWGNDEDDSNNEKGSEQENDSQKHESDSEQDTDGSESDFESDQQDDDDDEVNDNDDDDDEDDEEDDDNDDDKSEDIPPADTEIVSPLDVYVHHETNIPQSSQTFTSPPLQSTPSPLPTTETTNIPSSISDFASVFGFNDRVIALEKDVVELKNDPLHSQVTALVDDHLDTRMGATREEFMNFLSASLTDKITKQVKNQLPQILPEEVSNFAPLVIEKMIQESLNQVNLAKASSQPQSSYEAVATLTEFELKKILIDKMNSSESYLTAPEHRECYDGLIKCYNLDKDFFSSYDVYSLKRSRDDKDKDEGPSAGSDRGLKKRKKSKDAEPTTSPKTKDSLSRSSKGAKSQPKSFGKSVHAEEPEFKVGDTNTPQGQEGNPGNDNGEPRTESASRRAWFTKPLRAAFRLLKDTRSNYAELKYDFKECYKALSENLDGEILKAGQIFHQEKRTISHCLLHHKLTLWYNLRHQIVNAEGIVNVLIHMLNALDPNNREFI
nr:hypothetical protein [Tanacetum cinerariifolium]